MAQGEGWKAGCGLTLFLREEVQAVSQSTTDSGELRRPRLLMFAHTPPPEHGQARMVALILEGLGGDIRKRNGIENLNQFPIEVVHVNARLSSGLEDVGVPRAGKIFQLLKLICEAVYCRFRYDVPNLFYIPAPPKKSAMLRDCLVGFLLRPWFTRTIFNHRAAGLGEWINACSRGSIKAFLAARVVRCALQRPSLSIVSSRSLIDDARAFCPGEIEIIQNGLPDPCPDFYARVLPLRRDRLACRMGKAQGGLPYRVLFLSNLIPEKGLFETLQAVEAAAASSAFSWELHLAGHFQDIGTEERVKELIDKERISRIFLHGFARNKQKENLLIECDVLSLPTYYSAEAFPGVIVEALAFGMPVVLSNWRGINELVPSSNPGPVEPRNPDALAVALEKSVSFSDFEENRQRFENEHSLQRLVDNMTRAIVKVAAR